MISVKTIKQQYNYNIDSNCMINLSTNRYCPLTSGKTGILCSHVDSITVGDIEKKLERFCHKDHECSICLEEFDVNDRIVATPCAHLFHASCIGFFFFLFFKHEL